LEEDFEIPEIPQAKAHREIMAHHGKLDGLEDRSKDRERLKLWYLPSFMDAASYTVISTWDEQDTFLRKTIWRLSSWHPNLPRQQSFEKKISIHSFNKLQCQLAEIKMNPFNVSTEQILDAGVHGIIMEHGDARIDLTWCGLGDDNWNELGAWFGKTLRYFELFFPKNV
jgi:hypothetical protein